MEKKKNNKSSLIFLAIGIVMIIGGFIYAFLGTDVFKSKGNSNNNEEKDDNGGTVTESKYSAVYEKDGVKIKTYQKANVDEKSVFFEEVSFAIGDYFSGSMEMKNNVGTYEFFDEKITFTFSDDSLELEVNDEMQESYPEMKSGKYKKVQKYTNKDYYEDNLGELEYFNTKYNGKYKYNNNILYAYQVSKNEIFVYIYGASNNSITSISFFFDIDENGNIVSQSSYSENDTIIFENDTATVKFVDYPDVSGKYEKEKTLSIDEAIAVY